MNYPQQVSPNGWSILGDALSQGGKVIDAYQTQQEAAAEKAQRLKMLMEDMAIKKQEAAMAKIKADREAAIANAEEARKSAKEADRLDFQSYSKGDLASPTAAANPGLNQPAIQPYGARTQDIKDLENVQGLNLPSQPIAAGDNATSMMDAALRKTPGQSPTGYIPRTKEELALKALQTGQTEGYKQFADATKDPAIKANRANPLIASTIRDAMVEMYKTKKSLTRDDIRDITIKNDPDGTFMGTREYNALISSSSPAVAIQNANLAAKRLANDSDHFDTNTNIKLKEQLDTDPYIKPFAVADRKYTQTQAVYNKYKKTGNPSFVDRTLVVNFNKMIDETSAVMGGEVDATIKEMGVSDRLLGKISKWNEGGAGFTDEERGQIMDVMGSLHDQLKTQAKSAYFTARGQASDLGADPDIVTGLYAPLFSEAKQRYTPDYAPPKKGAPKASGKKKSADDYLKAAGL